MTALQQSLFNGLASGGDCATLFASTGATSGPHRINGPVPSCFTQKTTI